MTGSHKNNDPVQIIVIKENEFSEKTCTRNYLGHNYRDNNRIEWKRWCGIVSGQYPNFILGKGKFIEIAAW